MMIKKLAKSTIYSFEYFVIIYVSTVLHLFSFKKILNVFAGIKKKEVLMVIKPLHST